MELDAQQGVAGQVQGLGKAALRPGGGPQALSQAVYRLVVGAVDREDMAVELVENGALRGKYGVDQVALA